MEVFQFVISPATFGQSVISEELVWLSADGITRGVGPAQDPQAKAGFGRIEQRNRQVQAAERDNLPDFVHRVTDRRAQPHFTQESH